MKLYRDAFEEKARYLVLLNLGFDKEISLGNMMSTDLSWVNGISIGVTFVILLFWHELSVRTYGRNAGI